MSTHPIFFDPSGARASWLKRSGAGLGLVALVSGAAFGVSVMNTPAPARAKALQNLAHIFLPSKQEQTKEDQGKPRDARERDALWKQVALGSSPASLHAQTASNAPVVAAFYAPYQNTGLASFKQAAPGLTHVMPDWVHLNADGQSLNLDDFSFGDNPANREVIQVARRNGVAIMPIFSNASSSNFDPARVERLLASPAKQQALVANLSKWLVQNKFAGLNLDFENLNGADYARLPAFMGLLWRSLHQNGMALSVDVEGTLFEEGHLSLARSLGAASDFSVLMAYDQHDQGGTAGPIAAFDWSTKLVHSALKAIPASKLVLGVGNYAYNWLDKPGAKKQDAGELTYQEAVLLASRTQGKIKPQDAIDFDPQTLNATFNYRDGRKQAHEVWMLDGASAYNDWKLLGRAHLRGGALWVLGSEDPSVWDFWNKHSSPDAQVREQMDRVHFPFEVAFSGQGEVLSLASQPRDGARDLDFDGQTGLITDENYSRFPTTTSLWRSGFSHTNLALTFDDGPDPQWTPAILDELKKYNVKATFFVMGYQAERYPGLVRRMWDEGHDIGNHSFNHPDLGAVSARRVEWEINETQRAIESITGHATTEFRPPYTADAEPQTVAEVAPVQQAAALGYKTIGEYVDPQDWNPTITRANNQVAPRTVDDIKNEILRQVQLGRGNIILLHDAGGDRSKTIAALDQVLPILLKHHRLVPVSSLMNETRAQAMPTITGHEALVVAFDRFFFNVWFSAQWLLGMGFVLAIGLGIARMAFIVPLALVARKREQAQVFPLDYAPTVSVLVAAFNEEQVIERTLRSILNSDYPSIEVVVVDDGSKDGTFEAVQSAFGDDARVRVFRQVNGGKASALNHAIAQAHGEIYVGFDADTQVAPDAISLLVRHFSNPKIGAVAGNVTVGNRLNIWTRWQAIEYITSQNLDRRAFGLLNAISVVPGAIGAWRASAIKQVGAYQSDTLAEDMDLTWRLHGAGWLVANETKARAFTEAPDSLSTLFKQRFRWGYGTLQCLAKHRKMLGRCGWFGKLALPMIWVFQFGLQWIAPLVDVMLVGAAVSVVLGERAHGLDAGTLASFHKIAAFTLLFFLIELIGAFVAIRLDDEDPKLLPLLLLQRFVYRQMLYVVVCRATWTALSGFRQGWGKLARKGTVVVSKAKVA